MSLARAPSIKEGDLVEVINIGPGFEHFYYAARVISPVHCGRCKIRYDKLVREDDETQLLEEEVLMAKLRPYLEAIPQWNFFCGEIVDRYWNEGWWLGRIVQMDGERYIIRYKDRSHHVHAFQYTRLHHDWCQGAWMYAKLSANY